MKLYGIIKNRDLELSLVKALARAGVTTEHVDSAEDADVLVIFEKGHGFGVALDEVKDLLAMGKPKAVVAVDGWEGDEFTTVVRPQLVNRKLKVRMSDVVEAVLNAAPPDFEIEDDTDRVEFEDDVPPTLGDRLSEVLGELHDTPRAEKSIALKGCKGGVGTTTLAACLTQAFSELGAVHVEPVGTGRVYHGDESGAYATACPEGARVAVLDGESQGDVSIVVTDDSITSFNCLKNFLETDVPDIVVINRVRGGVPESVFRKEFPGVPHFHGVIDDYKACIDAQESGKVPTLLSPDMTRDVGKLAAMVRELLNI